MKQRTKRLLAMTLGISMLMSSAAPAYATSLEDVSEYDVQTESEQALTASEETAAVDESQLSPLLITEVVTDTVNGEKYTYVEVYNNSDQAVDFAEYNLYYDYPSGGGFVFSKNGSVSYTNGKAYTQGAWLSAEDNTNLDSIMVGSGETLIIWYNNNLDTTSLEEFRTYYGIGSDVNVVRVNHGGIHSSQKRGYRIGKDSDTVLVEAYSDEYGNLIADGSNKDAYQFTYPTSGRKCTQTGIAAATPGSVTADQIPSARVTVAETPVRISNVTAAGNGDLVVTAEIPYQGTAGAMAVNLTYTQSNGTITSEAAVIEMVPAGDGKTFTATVPSTEIWGTTATYSITAGYSADNKAATEEQTVALTRKEVSDENAAPLIITEVAPTSEEDGAERYDFFEVYNQSDDTINLGYWNILYYYNYPSQTAAQNGKTWTLSDFTVTLDPGETMVYWLNNKGLTVDDFNNFYGTDLVEGENITQVNYSGLHATDARWIRLGTSESNAFTLATFNEDTWQLTTSGNSLHYAAPNDDSGINESIAVTMSSATPGTVESWQVTGETVPFGGYPGYQEDDGEAPTLKVCEVEGKPVPESINEGDLLEVMYDVDLINGANAARVEAFSGDNHGGSEALKTRPRLIGTEIYYKLDNDTEWTIIRQRVQPAYGHFLMQLTSDILYGHDQVTFKVRAYTLYGYSETEENTVKINRLNDTKGEVRLNVQDGALVSGITTITANDGNNNANTTIQVDGIGLTNKKSFENGAYFIVKTSGMNSYFKNAVTAPYGDDDKDIITILTSWEQLPTSRAIRVDNKYFTYNEETDTYDVTITLWAGGTGTPFEEIYEAVKGENHEDFNVTGLQLKLANGNSYLPTVITPDNEKTNTSTELNAVHNIGDSAGWEPSMNVTFSVPAEDAEAVGVTFNTASFADGEHTITTTAGEKTTTATVIVDNTAPEVDLGIAQGAVLYDEFSIDETMINDANGVQDIVVSLDDQILTLPATVIPHELSVGEHTIKVVAVDAAGNTASEEVTFVTEEVDPSVTDTNNDGIGYNAANLSVSLEDGQEATVTFLEGQTLTTDNAGITTQGVTAGTDGEAPYQVFSVNTGDVSGDTEIALSWNGTASNTDATHPLTMFVLNLNTNSWDAVGTADAEGNIYAEFLADEYAANGSATVLVQCVTEGNQPNVSSEAVAAAETEETTQVLSDWDGTGRPEHYDFAFAWETDTQYYAESFPYHYDQMNQWIVDNADEWKIRYVFHTGDIVDDCNMIGEWENADHSMSILDDAGIPYGVLGGNHDVYAGAEGYGSYWQYFGEDRFAGRSYYGGSYKNNLGHYDLLTENGEDFIIIYMSWDIYEEELNWMNEVLQQYSDRKAILAFHRYIDTSGALDYTGALIQDQVVAKNPNVFAVIDGHYHGASFRTDKFDDDGDGVEERTVYQICTDYQSDPEGGSEYIKFMYFDLENNKLYMNSYSPYRDDFNYYDTAKLTDYTSEQQVGAIDIVEFDVDFGGTESYNKSLTTNSISADVRTSNVIGTVENAGGNAAYVWEGLMPETTYSWYAKVTNVKNGITKTAVQSFTTEAEPVAVTYTITAAAGAGGTISNSGETEVSEGADMTYTVTADAGYRVASVLVDGQAAELTDGTYTFENVSAAHTIEVQFETIPDIDIEVKLPYIDVNEGDFYYEAAKYAYKNGIMTGLSETIFGGDQLLSRAQFATILHRVEGKPAAEYDADRFTDVVLSDATSWYVEPVMWASEKGVITGYADGSFGPADSCTREQMITMMYRYAKASGYDVSAGADLSVFPDGADVSEFAQEAMSWAVAEGLISGDNGNINPQGIASRAQTVTIIKRYVDNVVNAAE